MADSKLPGAMQDKKEALQSQETTQEEQSTPADQAAPSEESPAAGSETDRVTLSRKEFNELQAAADKVKAAEGRAQSLRDDVEGLQARLTELEKAPKDSPMAGAAAPAEAPPAIQFDPSQTELTKEEEEEFEQDTIALIHKIARNVARQEIANLIPKLDAKLSEVESAAKSAVSTVGKVSTNNFTGLVRNEIAKYSDFDTLVNHPHWQDFLQAEDAISGKQYARILTDNIQNENLKGVLLIFRMFYDKYVDTGASRPNGYSGAEPTQVTNVPESNNKGTLKISDRREAHKKFINKEIDVEKYEQIKKAFDIADREGRVDYNN